MKLYKKLTIIISCLIAGSVYAMDDAKFMEVFRERWEYWESDFPSTDEKFTPDVFFSEGPGERLSDIIDLTSDQINNDSEFTIIAEKEKNQLEATRKAILNKNEECTQNKRIIDENISAHKNKAQNPSKKKKFFHYVCDQVGCDWKAMEHGAKPGFSFNGHLISGHQQCPQCRQVIKPHDLLYIHLNWCKKTN